MKMANTIGSLLEAKLAALERNAAVRREMPSPHHETFFFFFWGGGGDKSSSRRENSWKPGKIHETFNIE